MATRQDIRINQGETWSHTFPWSANLSSGYSAAMSIKKVPGQTTTALAYLSTGTDADGGTLALGNQTITASMTAAQTAALLTDVDIYALILPEKRRKEYVEHEECFLYDINLTNTATGAVTRAYEGKVTVRRSVTP